MMNVFRVAVLLLILLLVLGTWAAIAWLTLGQAWPSTHLGFQHLVIVVIAVVAIALEWRLHSD